MSGFSEPQAYLAAIVASSDDAIVSKDLNGVITSWNPAAERIFGFSSAEAVGRHISLIIPEDRLTEETFIIGKIKQGERISHFETVRQAKDGRLLNLSVTVSPIANAKGELIGASKVARDISERIKIEQALQALNRKKDEFLANMSHELRTPMNAVIGLTSLLEHSISLSERDQRLIATLKASADNMMELINDLLDFAKLEADAVELEKEDFDLAGRVRAVMSIMTVKAKEKHLALKTSYSPDLGRFFRGDPLRVHQVLTNLVSNAIKFTEHGSIRVEVEGSPAGGRADAIMVTIRVKDTGIGIAQDKLGVIFEKFVQADTSMTRRYGGSGLGLTISKSLVEKMGGAITVESELGTGTCFTVTLPLEHAVQPAHIEAQAEEQAGQETDRNILLVEDYEPNVLVARLTLEQLGYECDIARSGIEALKKFERNAYDLILMDVQMHDMDGLEATRRIRALEKEKGLRPTSIVAMTAHVREQDRNSCIEAGMNDFIPKPFDLARISAVIAHHMQMAAERN